MSASADGSGGIKGVRGAEFIEFGELREHLQVRASWVRTEHLPAALGNAAYPRRGRWMRPVLAR